MSHPENRPPEFIPPDSSQMQRFSISCQLLALGGNAIKGVICRWYTLPTDKQLFIKAKINNRRKNRSEPLAEATFTEVLNPKTNISHSYRLVEEKGALSVQTSLDFNFLGNDKDAPMRERFGEFQFRRSYNIWRAMRGVGKSAQRISAGEFETVIQNLERQVAMVEPPQAS